VTTILVMTGCAGSDHATSAADISGPAIGACLKMPTVTDLTGQQTVPCAAPHEGQVYAVIALPASITDPSVRQQVSAAKASLTCPDVRIWAGYRGPYPLGVFRTWRLPTKKEIAAGARWAACVAILAPGPDHVTLKATAGSLRGSLAGRTNPLPRLGQCSGTHTNTAFTPVTCVPGSTQWVWLGAHRKPTGTYPGKTKAKTAADSGCRHLVSSVGDGGAWVYYPTTATAWNRTRADWSCWMPLAQTKG
jgi:hypothetical protein